MKINKNTKKILSICISAFFIILSFLAYNNFFPLKYSVNADLEKDVTKKEDINEPLIKNLVALNTADYDFRMLKLANNPVPKIPKTEPVTDSNNKTPVKPATPPIVAVNIWPVKTVYPNAGALLPFNRIIAYYGNFYSKKMGVLGEYPEAIMLQKLNAEIKKWETLDPETPVIPAVDYIAITAQASAGKDGKYRFRMPDEQIDKAVILAKKINGIVILDIQVGLSTLQTELPLLEKYLRMPEVHLAIDPEFSMKTGKKPGAVIGTFDAADINYAASYLAKLVKENNLPPKILIVHRFTGPMVTNYKKIVPIPEVQIVMHMDGWGGQNKKINTYRTTIAKEPVQFAGFKLFYKNDLQQEKNRLMTPEEVLTLQPKPIFIQYQ